MPTATSTKWAWGPPKGVSTKSEPRAPKFTHFGHTNPPFSRVGEHPTFGPVVGRPMFGAPIHLNSLHGSDPFICLVDPHGWACQGGTPKLAPLFEARARCMCPPPQRAYARRARAGPPPASAASRRRPGPIKKPHNPRTPAPLPTLGWWANTLLSPLETLGGLSWVPKGACISPTTLDHLGTKHDHGSQLGLKIESKSPS